MKRFRRFLELRSAAKRRVEKEKRDTEWARERAADLKWARTSYALYTRGEGDFNG